MPASSCQSPDKGKQIAMIKSQAVQSLCTWSKYIWLSWKSIMHCLALISRGHFVKRERKLQLVEERRNLGPFSPCSVKQLIRPSQRAQQRLWQLWMSLAKGWIYLSIEEMSLEKAVSAANRTQQSMAIKSNPCLLSQGRVPQLQLDCNPHLGNLNSPPVFFGCSCDTLQLLSTEFRTFVYSSGYSRSLTKFNSLPLSNWLTS